MANAIDQASDTSGQVDTSNVTDTEDTNLDDITWDDGDVVEETTEESDTDSAATEEVETTEEESADDTEEEAADDTSDADTEASNDEEQTGQTDTDAQVAERQRQNQEAAARRIAERQARDDAKRQAEQQALDEAYQNSYDQAVNAGFDDQQARLQAAQALTLQQLQLDAYNNRVMQVTNRVTSDLNTAVTAIPEFRSSNPVVQEAMLRAVDNFEAAHVIKDQNGDPVQITGDILAYLQSEAETIRRLTGVGAQQQEQAKNTQKKRTLSPPSRAPKKAKVDQDLADFDEAYNQWK